METKISNLIEYHGEEIFYDFAVHWLECIKNILRSDNILAVIPGHLYYETADERFEIINSKLETIISATH